MRDPDTGRSRDIGVTGAIRYRDARLYQDSWALVIGINRYRHVSIPALEYAEDDAVAMGNCFRH